MAVTLAPESEFALDLSELSIEEGVALLIQHAVGLPASDLFFTRTQRAVVVSMRHLGTLHELASLPPDKGQHYLNSIKARAGMDVAQPFHPLDGRWLYGTENGRTVDLRISTIPTLFGETMAIRLLDRGSPLMDLHNLGFRKTDLYEMLRLLNRPSGLILITGPTGTGKTTTACACLQHQNNGARRMHAIEDPVEYALEGVCQSQVNPKNHLDFPELLRAVLRQSPDVIAIGEIRDVETAAIAVQAACSGCLVLATLHASTAAAAIDSMLALGVHPHFLATSLLAVVAQRLIRTLCQACRVPFDVAGAGQAFDSVKPWLPAGQSNRIFAPGRCDTCHQQGYSGLTGVFELLRMSDALRKFILENRSAVEIHAQARQEGMLELHHAALLKVAEGLTSLEEVVRVIPVPQQPAPSAANEVDANATNKVTIAP